MGNVITSRRLEWNLQILSLPLSALGSLTLIVVAGADMIVLADIPLWI